ncbi:hypothetical protein [Streptomyces cavernae]|uniref:hypothetical protein n=1 Tax=Streptomyces cavernae TaxID=2259034 RepID=UPI000FEB851D|nr:hypothetical protein [Streptomyces cavernae]
MSPVVRAAGLRHGAAQAEPPARPLQAAAGEGPRWVAGEATAEQMIGMIWASATTGRRQGGTLPTGPGEGR